MRVWDIHPGYLSRQSLLGEHAEIHALYNIITGNKRGYSRHPETLRWAENSDLLVLRHNLLTLEMKLRGFQHHSPLPFSTDRSERERFKDISYVDLPSAQFEILRKKYAANVQKGRIPLPANGTEFWAHHKYSVMARGYQYYKEIQQLMKDRQNLPVVREHCLIKKIHTVMNKEIPVQALDNVLLHLWGYFKDKACREEKERFFHLTDSTEKMKILYGMSQEYRVQYLLHSTIFADFLPDK